MKVAIMQPYYFPYIGYFQLIVAADKFVVYDDVNYINKGWINRNRIMLGGKPYLFTIPLRKVSQNKLINETEVVFEAKWIKKFYSTIEYSYKKSSNFLLVMNLLKEIHSFNDSNLSAFLTNTISKICEYLCIKTQIVSSSSIYSNRNLKGQSRIIDICYKEGADTYINPIGGLELYTREEFYKRSIDLKFLKTTDHSYNQPSSPFVPNLSIIDLLFNCSKDVAREIIYNNYILL